MFSSWVSSRNLAVIFHRSEDFWWKNIPGGWATIIALLFILIWQSARLLASRFRTVVAADVKSTVSLKGNSQIRIADIISDVDLRNLINNLDGELDKKEKWDDVIDKRNIRQCYNVKCCKPEEGPLKYLSVTIFENCSTELLRDFFMDYEYRKQWDETLVKHEQLQLDESSGTEIGHTIKKFPLLTPREYVLAWRVWEGKEKTFYCFIKECEHALAPRQRKYVRVGFFRSGWRIRKVPGRYACEIKMLHQEDAGLNVEMAKLAFSKGIWSYVCKMDNALRKYSPISRPLPSAAMTAVTFIQKVPPELDTITNTTHEALPRSSATGAIQRLKERRFSRRPSKKLLGNGLLLLGGVVCLSLCHSRLCAKIAMPFILKKLTKRGASSSQNGKN